MAVIEIPARSIVGEPKLNIANDNTYESVGYNKQERSYDKYIKLWERELNIIDMSLLASRDGTVLWSPPFSMDYQPNYLGTDTGGGDLKFYRYKEGSELIDNFKLFIPSGVSSKYNYHDFVIKITIPKPDKNIDYSKLKFRYMDDVTSNRPVPDWDNVVLDSARLKDFTDGDFTKPIEEQYIYDKNTSETEILHTFVNSDFSATLTYNTQDVFVKLRITDDNLEFYCIATAIIGTPATKNVGGSISMIYTRTLAFYYVDMQTTSKGEFNETSKYSLPDNELLAEQTTYNGTSIYDQISNSIVSEYERGKFSIDLNCLYMKYFNAESHNEEYSGEDGKTISVGDLIIPTTKEKEMATTFKNLTLQGKPYATNKNGVPCVFKVIKSELNTNDSKYITNSISAVEFEEETYITMHQTSENDLSVFVNGQQVYWENNNNFINVRTGDIVTFKIKRNDAFVNISTNGKSWLVGSDENPKIAIVSNVGLMLVLPTN